MALSKNRDRIQELRYVPANELLPNPKNWRKHPDRQRAALRSLLATIGLADAVLARETPHGLQLIDGHLRTETAGTATLPVLVLDVTESEADLILATFDPLASLADTDQAAASALLESLRQEAGPLADLWTDLASLTAEKPKADAKPKIYCCPDCGHEFTRDEVDGGTDEAEE